MLPWQAVHGGPGGSLHPRRVQRTRKRKRRRRLATPLPSNSMLFVAILPFSAKNICHCFRLLMSIAKHIFVSILVTAYDGLLLNLFLHSIFCLHARVSFNLCRRNHHRSQAQSSRHVTPGHHTRRRATSSLVVAEARDPRRTGGKAVRPADARHNPSVNLAWAVSEPLRLLEHRAWSSSPRLKLVLCASAGRPAGLLSFPWQCHPFPSSRSRKASSSSDHMRPKREWELHILLEGTATAPAAAGMMDLDCCCTQQRAAYGSTRFRCHSWPTTRRRRCHA